jgi:hypothetical protein
MTTAPDGQLTAFEAAVLSLLLDGEHPLLAQLRAQATGCTVLDRTFTEVGFWTDLAAAPASPPLEGEPSFELGDVVASIPGGNHGAGFVLFVRDGRLAMLEGYTYDDPWPDDVSELRLGYASTPRDLSIDPRPGREDDRVELI